MIILQSKLSIQLAAQNTRKFSDDAHLINIQCHFTQLCIGSPHANRPLHFAQKHRKFNTLSSPEIGGSISHDVIGNTYKVNFPINRVMATLVGTNKYSTSLTVDSQSEQPMEETHPKRRFPELKPRAQLPQGAL